MAQLFVCPPVSQPAIQPFSQLLQLSWLIVCQMSISGKYRMTYHYFFLCQCTSERFFPLLFCCCSCLSWSCQKQIIIIFSNANKTTRTATPTTTMVMMKSIHIKWKNNNKIEKERRGGKKRKEKKKNQTTRFQSVEHTICWRSEQYFNNSNFLFVRLSFKRKITHDWIFPIPQHCYYPLGYRPTPFQVENKIAITFFFCIISQMASKC